MRTFSLALGMLFSAALARADDTAAGQARFRVSCALCHATTDRAGQGPGLAGIVGRKAASGPGFGYSKALSASGLTWTEATLDRYLAAPSKLVPGTRMAMATPNANDRRQIVQYLRTLEAVASPPEAPPERRAGPSTPAPVTPTAEVLTGAAALGDFRGDGPGVRRRLALADLPAPFATPSARNSPRVSDPPPGAMPRAPPGFVVGLFAKNLDNPRLLRVAPNGDVFVAESNLGQVVAFHGKAGAAQPESQAIFATGLDQPFGIAFYPPGPTPHYVYVANTDSVVRFPYASGDLKARGRAEVIVRKLTRSRGGGHWTRDLVFSPDGTRMFVSVGSASNVAEGEDKWSPAQVQTWEKDHGLGAAWGNEEGRADVRVFSPDGKSDQVFATGIRNCVGLAVSPVGDLWCSTNERDGLGDDLVPDYLTRVKEGAFYGWPWRYLGDHEDPRHAGERPDLKGKVTLPDVLVQAHSASLQLAFYDGKAFPAEYQGDAFAAFHGSWNRAERTGYKVVRVRLRDGQPTGEYDDFLTGFVLDDGHVWGRPVGVAVAKDGALLVSEDANGTIWRIARP